MPSRQLGGQHGGLDGFLAVAQSGGGIGQQGQGANGVAQARIRPAQGGQQLAQPGDVQPAAATRPPGGGAELAAASEPVLELTLAEPAQPARATPRFGAPTAPAPLG